MKKVYLDNAATTYTDKRVYDAMKPYFCDIYGNPSSFHTIGKQAQEAVDAARGGVADILGCRRDEIIFTSGGTESDNLALIGFARANQDKGKHIISTPIEHKAILATLKQLEKEGFEVTLVDVDEHGLIDPKKLSEAIRPDTILVSVMFANNEVGTIEPIADIGREILKIRKANKSEFPYFHTDACQAAGVTELDVEKLHVDMMTINGGKIYGPKGIGMLYKRRNVKIEPIIFGGDQEYGLRPGTENIPGIIGLAKALEIAQEEKEIENERLIELRDYLIKEIQDKIPDIELNGHPTERLPNNVNISFPGVEGEALMLYLDAKGIFVGTGSACTSKTLAPSHVITALHKPAETAHTSIRMTLGRATTKKDLDYTIEVLVETVKKLRQMSAISQ